MNAAVRATLKLVTQTAQASFRTPPKYRAIAWTALGLELQVLIFCFGFILVGWIISRLRGASPKRRKEDAFEDVESSVNDNLITTSASNVGVGFLAVLLAASGALAGSGSTFVGLTVAALPIIVPIAVLFGASIILHTSYDTILPWLQFQLQCRLYGIIHHFLHPLLKILLDIYQATYGIVAMALRLMSVFPPFGTGWVKYVFIVALPAVADLMKAVGRIAYETIYSVAFFVTSNPLFGEPLLFNALKAIFEFVDLIRGKILEPLCSGLMIALNPFIKSLNDPEFSATIDYAVRFVWKTIMSIVVIPILTISRPSIRDPYDRQVKMVQSAARWVQNLIIGICTEWVDETLPLILSNAAPLPVDEEIYLVRFLRARWVESIGELLNALMALCYWEILDLAFHVDMLVTSVGRDLWTFSRVTLHFINAVRYAETLINIIPPINNGFAQNIPVGNLLSLFDVLLWFIIMIETVAIAELYTTIFDGLLKFGSALASFLQFERDPLLKYRDALERFWNAVGALVGFIDRYIAGAVSATGTSLLFYIPRIPLELLAYIRAVLETKQVNLLDGIHYRDLDNKFEELSSIGFVFFQFQNGASPSTCAQSPTFFCSLGLLVKYTLLAVMRTVILIIVAIITILKIVISLIYQQTLNTLMFPDFDPVVEAIDIATCRLGTAALTLIPFKLSCNGLPPNMCRTKQYPSVPNTVETCLGTTGCTVFRVLSTPVHIFVRVYQIITRFQSVQQATTEIVRQVADILIYHLLPPICPIAHLLDCALAAIVPFFANKTTATDFVCRLMAFVIYMFKSLTETFVKAINLLFRVFAFITNPFLEGNPIETFFGLILQFFELIVVQFIDIIKKIIGFVLQAVVLVLFKICQFFRADWADVEALRATPTPRPCDDLRDVLRALKEGFGPIPTDPDNYRKRNIQEILNKNTTCYAMPYVKVLFKYMYPDMSADRLEQYRMCPDTQSTADTADARIYAIMGAGPVDAEDLVRYLFERITWTEGSKCARLIYAYRNVKRSALEPLVRIEIEQCAESMIYTAGLQSMGRVFEWVPLDLFYNDKRKLYMLFQTAQFAAVASQWTLDRYSPLNVLISDKYINSWSSIGVNTEHYKLLRKMYPGTKAPPHLYAPLHTYIQKRTLAESIRATMPQLYNASQPYTSTLDEFTTAVYESTSNLLQGILDERYDVAKSVISANESQSMMGAYYMDANGTAGSYVRDRFGSRADSYFNERMSTISFYEILSEGYITLYETASNISALWRSDGSTNFKRSVEGVTRLARVAWRDDLQEADPEIYEGWKHAKRSVSEGWMDRVQDMRLSLTENSSDKKRSVDNEEVTSKSFAKTLVGFAEMVAGRWAHDEHVDRLCPAEIQGEACRVWLQETGSTRIVGTNVEVAARTKRSIFEPEIEPLDLTTSSHNTIVNFFGRVFKARGPRATQNREIWSRTWSSTMTTISSTWYVLFGDDVQVQPESISQSSIVDTVSQMQLRLDRILSGAGPHYDVLGTYVNKSRDTTTDPAEIEEQYRQWRQSNATAGFERAWSAFVDSYKNHRLAQDLLGETEHDKFTGHSMFSTSTQHASTSTEFPAHAQEWATWRRRIVESTREWIEWQADRDEMSQLFQESDVYSRNNPDSGAPMTFMPRSARMRRALGLPPQETDDPMGDRVLVQSYLSLDLESKPTVDTSVEPLFNAAQQRKTTNVYKGQAGVDALVRMALKKANLRSTTALNETRYYNFRMKNVIMIPHERKPAHMNSATFAKAVQDGKIKATVVYEDLDNFLVRECTLGITALCEQCWALDIALGLFASSGAFIVYYYTGPHATYMAETSGFLPYTFDLFGNLTDRTQTIARSGNGTNSPWFFGVNEPIGTMLQFSPFEVQNGLDPFRWVNVALNGGSMPPVANSNGPFYEKIRDYVVARDLALAQYQPFSRQFAYDIMWTLQYDLGIRAIDFTDTVISFLDQSASDVGYWIFQRVRKCTYTPPRQVYSWVGGALITSLYLGVASVASYIILSMIMPAVNLAVLGSILSGTYFIHLTLSYEWSIACVLPPPLYFVDMWKFFAYDVAPKCNLIIGTMISSTNYTAQTCALCENTPYWEFADCEELGFKNVWDATTFVDLWLFPSTPITPTLMEWYQTLLSWTLVLEDEPSPTTTWPPVSLWDTKPVWQRNAKGCAIKSTIPYLLGALIVILLLALLVLSIIPNVPQVLASGLAVFMALSTLSLFALSDLENQVTSMSREMEYDRGRRSKGGGSVSEVEMADL